MKIRPLVLWTCIFAIVLLVLFWFTKRPGTKAVSSQSSTARNVVESTPEENAPFSRRRVTARQASVVTNGTPIEAKEDRARTVLSELNDVPIIFYGTLQDQFGNPIAGAEIIGSVIIDNGVREGTEKVSAISDANGFFKLNGGNGESLGVMPRKEGYALTSTQTEFKYSHFYPESRHLPDARNPIVFKMWKLQGGERLIHFQFKARIPCNGESERFDLQTGRRVESGGDILIQVESPTKANAIEKYSWKAVLQPVDGGIIPYAARMESVFLAPEAGYETKFITGYQQDALPWSSRFNGSFYLKARNGGTYSKIDFGIVTDAVKDGSVPVMISGYINPAGSRNLEINSSLVIEAKP